MHYNYESPINKEFEPCVQGVVTGSSCVRSAFGRRTQGLVVRSDTFLLGSLSRPTASKSNACSAVPGGPLVSAPQQVSTRRHRFPLPLAMRLMGLYGAFLSEGARAYAAATQEVASRRA